MSPDGKVGCQFCNSYLEIKIHNCPFRFCSPLPMCPGCSKKNPHLKSKAGHRARGCEDRSNILRAEQRERPQIFVAGDYLLTLTSRVAAGLIHAIFRCGTKREGRFLTEELYERAIKKANTTLGEIENWAGMKLPEAPASLDGPVQDRLLNRARTKFKSRSEPATLIISNNLEQFSLF